MHLWLIYDWQRIFSTRRVSDHGYTFRVDKHLHSEDFSIEDYYFRAKSSPFGRIRLQRLFFPRWIHPHSEESSFRDYFPGVNSSLFGRIFFQGLFFQDEFIPIQNNFPPGIIFPRWIHPHSEESSSRDYFLRIKSSPYERICLQGCFGNIKVSAMAAKAN